MTLVAKLNLSPASINLIIFFKSAISILLELLFKKTKSNGGLKITHEVKFIVQGIFYPIQAKKLLTRLNKSISGTFSKHIETVTQDYLIF